MAENKHNGASNENGAETVLSESNVKFLVTIMQHLLTKPDVDWPKVADKMGVTAKSAKERYRLLEIKMGAKSGPSKPKTTPKKPTGVTKRKAPTGSARKGKGAKAYAEAQAEEPVQEKQDSEDTVDVVMGGDNDEV